MKTLIQQIGKRTGNLALVVDAELWHRPEWRQELASRCEIAAGSEPRRDLSADARIRRVAAELE